MNSLDFLFNGELVTVRIEREGDSFKVVSGDSELVFRQEAENLYTVFADGARHHLAVVKNKDTYYVDIDSVLLEVKEPSEDSVSGAAGGHGEKDKVYAPMPGKIVKLLVNIGDSVEEKQGLVIVEAMKMENKVISPSQGTVKAINCQPGEQVDTQTPLVELEIPEE